MSPKSRSKENSGLPRNWRWKGGGKGRALYFRVPKGSEYYWDDKTEFRLGGNMAEAHMEYAKRIGYDGKVVLMEQLCDRYTCEVLPDKAPATRRSNEYSLKRIRAAFEGNRVASILPIHIYKYRDAIDQKGSKKKANLDLQVLSHMFTKAIEWGVIHHHPMTHKKVTKFSLPTRKVKPIDTEMVAFIRMWPRNWQIYLILKVWWARRKGELLRVMKFDIGEQGVRFVNNKNPDDFFLVPWEPETRALVTELLNIPGAQHDTYLWETRDHECYVNPDGDASGFNSMWQRRMTKAIRDGIVTRRFTEHDMRKIRPSQLSAADAQDLLRHTTPKQTKTYQLNPTVVSLNKSKK